jgi:ribosomal protein S18 acetylase RimI-like enzyme
MKDVDAAQRSVTTTVTHLVMDGPPTGHPPPSPFLKTAILLAENPAPHFYRYLYETIGAPYLWVERRTWSDEKLAEHLSQEGLALYVLYIGGVPAGMAELDSPEEGAAQIAYFGLTPEFVGRRIGPWFLRQAIELAWARSITRLLVNTCTLDHRKALATYQRAGFKPYARGEKTIVIPPELPLP